MLRFIARRLLILLPTILAIVTLSFFVMRLAPGSPFLSERGIPPEVLRALDRRYGFDKPLHQQYLRYLGNLVRLDMGLSTKYPRMEVTRLIRMTFPTTMMLGAVALLWALMIGVSAGILAAVRQNSAWDYGSMSLALVGISIPSFVLGPLLILSFALTFFLLPPAGWGSVRHVFLPGITLGTVYAAYLARLTRGGMLEVVRQDFVRTARAKGLPERIVLFRHVLRGGIMPVVTFLGPMISHLLVGSIIVETIFAVPGTGPYLVTATLNRDYFLAMGMVVFYSLFLLTMNFLVDLVYGFLDPRVRFE